VGAAIVRSRLSDFVFAGGGVGLWTEGKFEERRHGAKEKHAKQEDIYRLVKAFSPSLWF